jgi:hypothetical protein
MAQPSFDDDNEAPLDPAVARVQTRLRRLMLISGLTLGVGIFAVFGAILYRIMTLDATPASAVSETAPVTATFSAHDLGLPADARLVSTALEGGRIVLTFAHSGGHSVVLVDQATNKVLNRIELPGY